MTWDDCGWNLYHILTHLEHQIRIFKRWSEPIYKASYIREGYMCMQRIAAKVAVPAFEEWTDEVMFAWYFHFAECRGAIKYSTCITSRGPYPFPLHTFIRNGWP